MKLSEAIRLGAMLRPQGFGRVLDRNGRTCALGAAYEAVGISLTQPGEIPKNWLPMLDYAPWSIPCPACGGRQTKADNYRKFTFGETVVTHLNDVHKWTREAIADWVATVEPEEMVQVKEVEAETSEVVRA